MAANTDYYGASGQNAINGEGKGERKRKKEKEAAGSRGKRPERRKVRNHFWAVGRSVAAPIHRFGRRTNRKQGD